MMTYCFCYLSIIDVVSIQLMSHLRILRLYLPTAGEVKDDFVSLFHLQPSPCYSQRNRGLVPLTSQVLVVLPVHHNDHCMCETYLLYSLSYHTVPVQMLFQINWYLYLSLLLFCLNSSRELKLLVPV